MKQYISIISDKHFKGTLARHELNDYFSMKDCIATPLVEKRSFSDAAEFKQQLSLIHHNKPAEISIMFTDGYKYREVENLTPVDIRVFCREIASLDKNYAIDFCELHPVNRFVKESELDKPRDYAIIQLDTQLVEQFIDTIESTNTAMKSKKANYTIRAITVDEAPDVKKECKRLPLNTPKETTLHLVLADKTCAAQRGYQFKAAYRDKQQDENKEFKLTFPFKSNSNMER